MLVFLLCSQIPSVLVSLLFSSVDCNRLLMTFEQPTLNLSEVPYAECGSVVAAVAGAVIVA